MRIFEIRIKKVGEVLDDFQQTFEAVKTGRRLSKREGVFFTSMEAARNLLTAQRVKLLTLIREHKPTSVYELAKLSQRDLKNVYDDVKLLEKHGILRTTLRRSTARTRRVPDVPYDEIRVSIPLRAVSERARAYTEGDSDPPDHGKVWANGREELWTIREYEDKLQEQISKVLDSHRELPDYREKYPWATGFLGNPFTRVWFVGEIPSITQIRKAHTSGLTPEMQWNISGSDRLFREMLLRHHFKDAPSNGSEGWRCYVTDIVKMPWRDPEEWRKWSERRAPERTAVVETWAGVLGWELNTVRPKLIVALGAEVRRLLSDLVKKQLIPQLPQTRKIHHPSFYQRADRQGRSPTDPARLAEFDRQFSEVRRAYEASRDDSDDVQ